MMAAVSLASKLMNQHGRVAETRRSWITLAAGAGPWTFRMESLAKGSPWSCPLEGCPVRVAMRTAMQVHFLHQHVLNNVVILEEGNLPHPLCDRCNILVPRLALNDRHPNISQCARGEEWKRRRLAEAETRDSLEKAFDAYGELLENVTIFRYLGRVLTAGYDDWLAVVVNLGKARKSWRWLSQILCPEGADPKVLRSFYKAVA